MSTILLCGLTFIILSTASHSLASTHWIVTENGRIQAQLDSAFHLRRPYDLLALLEQETRVRAIDELYRGLVTRKAAIDNRWANLEGATDLESRLYAEDDDCIHAGPPIKDDDLYESPLGDIKERIRLDLYLPTDLFQDGEFVEPDCIKSINLDFSMRTFEHLKAVAERTNLSINQDTNILQDVVGVHGDASLFGHQVSVALQKNITSWLHYNLAAAYWRFKGNGLKAIECARRAVHFSPRQFRDLALLNLGGVLLLSRHPAEAAIVLHAAVDHAPNKPFNHLALGNVYVILGDYNRSVACFDNALKLHPSLEPAIINKHSMLCLHKLEKGLLQLHGSLEGIVADLNEYHSQQKLWLKHQENAVWQQAPLDIRLLDVDQQMLASAANRGQSCMQKMQSGRTVFSCDASGDSQLLAHSITLSLQMLLKNVEAQTKLISEHMSIRNLKFHHQHLSSKIPLKDPPPVPTMDSEKIDTEARIQKPPSESILEQDDWPSRAECTSFAEQFPPTTGMPSVFSSLESRGFTPSRYLSERINLTPGMEHSLPWYPPICNIASAAAVTNQNLYPPEIGLRSQLLKYGGSARGIEAEIGQRILTAINKGAGPRWLLHTLAALYWRVKGNGHHALDCLSIALEASPQKFRDIALVSQAAVLYQLRRTSEALQAVTEALNLNSFEPSANFMMAVILDSKKNLTGTTYHLLQVLIHGADSNFSEIALSFLRHTSCKQKFGSTDRSTLSAAAPEEMCRASGGKRRDVLKGLDALHEGETLLCSSNGEQCRTVECLGSIHETDPLTKEAWFDDDTWLNVHDKSGTYPLSRSRCQQLQQYDWDQKLALWLSAERPPSLRLKDIPELQFTVVPLPWPEPKCSHLQESLPTILEKLEGVRHRSRLQSPAEISLIPWLNAQLKNQATGNVHETRTALALALQENTTSWALANAAAIYWRIVGRADEAISCLCQALLLATAPYKKFPLTELATVLYRAKQNSDALTVAQMALEYSPMFEMAHFVIANIYSSMGQHEKAVSHYRSALAVEPSFEPARHRLQFALCQLLFEGKDIKPSV